MIEKIYGKIIKGERLPPPSFREKDIDDLLTVINTPTPYMDDCFRYLINEYDYSFCIELAFIDTFARLSHDESKCFMNVLRYKFDYKPERLK